MKLLHRFVLRVRFWNARRRIVRLHRGQERAAIYRLRVNRALERRALEAIQ